MLIIIIIITCLSLLRSTARIKTWKKYCKHSFLGNFDMSSRGVCTGVFTVQESLIFNSA